MTTRPASASTSEQDVGRQQHRALAAQLPDQRVRLPDLVRIQADGRLVEDQDRRPREQRVRQADPLPVAARQRADDLGAPLAEAGDADRVVDRRPPLAARDRPSARPGSRGIRSRASRAAAAPPRAGSRARAAPPGCRRRSSSRPAPPSPAWASGNSSGCASASSCRRRSAPAGRRSRPARPRTRRRRAQAARRRGRPERSPRTLFVDTPGR